MTLELCIFGAVAALGLVAATTTIGPAILHAPMEAAVDLRPFGVVAGCCLAAGLYLGIQFVRDASGLLRAHWVWWAFGWLGAFAVACVLGTWIYQLLSGERIGIGPDDPPELNPFGGPTREAVQYQLQIAALGVPLLIPWAHLILAWYKLRSNISLQTDRER